MDHTAESKAIDVQYCHLIHMEKKLAEAISTAKSEADLGIEMTVHLANCQIAPSKDCTKDNLDKLQFIENLRLELNGMANAFMKSQMQLEGK